MHLLGQRLLGTIVLVLLGLLVIAKRAATGNIIRDTPSGGFLLWVVHLFNLCFLLVVNPVAGILLVAGRFEEADVTRLSLPSPAVIAFEGAGIALSLLGYVLMAWALATLRRNYQVGGSVPRPADHLVAQGPYAIVRHPMYTAALCISLGLALATQSLALLTVTVLYLVLIVPLMPFEEEGLRRAYGNEYERYARGRRRLVPFVY